MSTIEEEVVPGEAEAPPEEAAARAAEQKRIDNEFAAAARDRARIQEQAAKLLDAAQRIEAQSKPKQPQAEDNPPARDEFDSYEGFLEAKLEYQRKDVQRYVDSQVENAVRLHRQSAEEGTVKARMAESARRGEEVYPGFTDIIEKVPPMPQAALQAWQELAEPEHVAHYLGTHQDEAKKIGRMTPGRAAHAVIALGERLDQERAGKNGAKEEPAEFGPKPGGKPAPSGVHPNMSMEAYEKARIAEKLRLMKG